MPRPAETKRLNRPLRVAMVACEASGDTLGGGLLEALRCTPNEIDAFGMTGERMRAAGCASWHTIDEVSVMGVAEVLPHLPRLLRLRRQLAKRIIEAQPDVFVGIDSPDFNQPIAKTVKAAGIPAIQYVSPQVWAWRQSRVAGIRDSIDKILCVLPFEAEFFAEHGIAADFVGHPLADAIPFSVDRNKARESIGCSADGPVIAILPGSRGSEVSRLAPPFFETAMWLSERRPDLRFVVALANEKAENIVKQVLKRQAIVPQPLLIRGRARDVIAAADVVLTASGTATLETLLLNRRMVVAHRMSPLTYWIVRRLGVSNLPNFSLPNLLAGRQIVPEFVQRQVRADLLGPAILDVLQGRRIDPQWREIFTEIHQNLHRDANRAAANSVLALVPGAT